MRAMMVGLVLVLSGCSAAVEPSTDAGSVDDSAVCRDMSVYNRSAQRMGCPETSVCPACPVLVNSGFDCASLARALEPCPVDAGAP